MSMSTLTQVATCHLDVESLEDYIVHVFSADGKFIKRIDAHAGVTERTYSDSNMESRNLLGLH